MKYIALGVGFGAWCWLVWSLDAFFTDRANKRREERAAARYVSRGQVRPPGSKPPVMRP